VSDERDACVASGLKLFVLRTEAVRIFLRIVSIYRALILSVLYSWSFAMGRLIASRLAAR
jgi:hypothetical protein